MSTTPSPLRRITVTLALAATGSAAPAGKVADATMKAAPLFSPAASIDKAAVRFIVAAGGRF